MLKGKSLKDLQKQTAFLYWREMTKTNSTTMTKHYQVYPNESNENVYKHEGLFTKAQVKINKLREWYIQNVYYEQAAALAKIY